MSNVDKHAPGTPAWFDVVVPDLDAALKFYGGLFGWQFNVGPAEYGYYTTCTLRDRRIAGMGKQMPEAPFPCAWSVYFCSENIEADLARVTEGGGKVVMGPMAIDVQGRMAVCADPTGAIFGFWEPRSHTGAQIVDEPGAMCWTEVATRDKGATAFYEKVLQVTSKPMEGGMVYDMLNKGDKTIAGVLHMNEQWPAEIPPHWMPYFAVANADESAAKIKELGGQVKHGPFDSPYGRICVVQDPFGAVFSIIQLSEKAAS